uniref:Uncharacterized protein n=1 Tax=Chrysotila carterae TaxID=13221 RepID=A0A7S4ETA8_CHRCT|mmetsp:Transcript_33279/g.73092  ORF Transcript_33279/g.73092 Transcript_33279/m.73092 type:complete len:372 (-) Transcript_33279:542-1657(-)
MQFVPRIRPPLQHSSSLDEADFLELQQLDHRLDELFQYTPSSAEELGLPNPAPGDYCTNGFKVEPLEVPAHAVRISTPMQAHDGDIDSADSVDEEPDSPMFTNMGSFAELTRALMLTRASLDSVSTHSDDISEESSGPRMPLKQRKTAWTNVEDCIIEEGVSQFGHKWSKIAEMLPNERTDDAVRNRWQRLRRRQQRRGAGLVRVSSEDSDRRSEASLMARTAARRPGGACPGAGMLVQCRTPCATAASETGNEQHGKHGDMWTPEEDRIIDWAVRVQGLRWRAIAEMLPGRTDSGCRNRWVRSQERLLSSEGVSVHGAAEVFAALRKAGRFPAMSPALKLSPALPASPAGPFSPFASVPPVLSTARTDLA